MQQSSANQLITHQLSALPSERLRFAFCSHVHLIGLAAPLNTLSPQIQLFPDLLHRPQPQADIVSSHPKATEQGEAGSPIYQDGATTSLECLAEHIIRLARRTVAEYMLDYVVNVSRETLLWPCSPLH
ncbi:hypothetical protein EPA93_32095 [Ktedonosporobacter rubrisoli]|uniref:Uncharacterized protein n=1 Tax=Ktedonosporobacter rubrisoli TaxID=2509675 RepID=A0A4P6JY02_KTERU|nr:hypothetical protein [Ktedonosporobacter rubrisoli]QBD80365.1 hypothetical protein EPA93_32095 [Ktedonosporobacter rubrisoli]